MMATLEQIKELRQQTGISIAECRQALESSAGDLEKALAVLKERGGRLAEKKASRALKAGTIGIYLHTNGLLAALAELRCETDFVAKNVEFRELANELAMQVAALGSEDSAEVLTQPFIKNEALTVADVIKGAVQKFGERIEVGRLRRLEVELD
jgi:elongation factor Ts